MISDTFVRVFIEAVLAIPVGFALGWFSGWREHQIRDREDERSGRCGRCGRMKGPGPPNGAA